MNKEFRILNTGFGRTKALPEAAPDKSPVYVDCASCDAFHPVEEGFPINTQLQRGLIISAAIPAADTPRPYIYKDKSPALNIEN